MNARLLYVMDPMCSWCWGFAPVLDALAGRTAEQGVALHLVAGGLRPGTVQALDGTTREHILRHWQAVTARTGQPFRFEAALPEGFVYDTEPASRALVAARSLAPERVWPLVRAIQQAFYVEGRDVTRAATLAALAEQAGLPRQAFAAAFDSAEQRLATADGLRAGPAIWASPDFPTLLAERKAQLALLTNGYQPLERLAPLLDRWLERRAHD